MSRAESNTAEADARQLKRREAAARLLARPFGPYRERSLWMPADSDIPATIAPALMLLDDSGGESITSFDDAEAAHFFLVWLRARRESMRQARSAAYEAEKKRSRLRVVKGGGQ